MTEVIQDVRPHNATATAPKLEIRGLRKTFGALVATNDVNLQVRPGEIHALIGPNGAGKTTLISQISGELMPDAGQILLDGADITRIPAHKRASVGLARSFQDRKSTRLNSSHVK